MIRRFSHFLLILLMLANQGLCLAHTHQGRGLAEPKGHASRPHFHFGGHKHHDASHGHDAHHRHQHHSDRQKLTDRRPTVHSRVIAPSCEHDADAVYISNEVPRSRVGSPTIVPPSKWVAGVFHLDRAAQNNDRLLCLDQPLSALDAGCPIFLRTLSLRL